MSSSRQTINDHFRGSIGFIITIGSNVTIEHAPGRVGSASSSTPGAAGGEFDPHIGVSIVAVHSDTFGSSSFGVIDTNARITGSTIEVVPVGLSVGTSDVLWAHIGRSAIGPTTAPSKTNTGRGRRRKDVQDDLLRQLSVTVRSGNQGLIDGSIHVSRGILDFKGGTGATFDFDKSLFTGSLLEPLNIPRT